MLTNKLIKSLGCIHCRGDLYLNGSVLLCEKCMATYEVKNGIPIFMKDNKNDTESLFKQERFSRWTSGGSVVTCENYAKNYKYKEFEEPILNICTGKVLEIGCGSGRILDKLKSSHKIDWLCGIDPSTAMLSKSHEKNYDVAQGIAEKLPFKDNYFDTVISVLYTMEYTERKLTYEEIYRVLKPGGGFAFDLLNYFQVVAQELWYTIRKQKIVNWTKDIKKKSKEQYWHLNIKNINSELKLLKSAGFENTNVMTTKFIPFFRKSHNISGYWNGRIAALIGHNIIIICKKTS